MTNLNKYWTAVRFDFGRRAFGFICAFFTFQIFYIKLKIEIQFPNFQRFKASYNLNAPAILDIFFIAGLQM